MATTPSYEKIKSEYAEYTIESNAAAKIKAVSDSLKIRSEVQPVPIDSLREKILHPRSMAVVQAVLFSILLSLIVMVVLPAEYASYVVFLTLCVGASAGIYLSTR